jgi:hypothetical protein
LFLEARKYLFLELVAKSSILSVNFDFRLDNTLLPIPFPFPSYSPLSLQFISNLVKSIEEGFASPTEEEMDLQH